jgi:hypothetical protein
MTQLCLYQSKNQIIFYLVKFIATSFYCWISDLGPVMKKNSNPG